MKRLADEDEEARGLTADAVTDAAMTHIGEIG
jgi:hypothetical protein